MKVDNVWWGPDSSQRVYVQRDAALWWFVTTVGRAVTDEDLHEQATPRGIDAFVASSHLAEVAGEIGGPISLRTWGLEIGGSHE